MKRDMVVGIVGTVILVAAMVGVFRYEAARGGGQSWTVTWSTGTEAGPEESGETQAGVTTPVELEIAAPNVTSIEFLLEWTDDVGAPDEFEVIVTSPTGENRTAKGSGGTLSVVFEDITPMPGEIRLLAASEAEAASRVARDATTHAADGVWNVGVRLASAPGVVAPAGGVEVQPDGQNAWTLQAKLTTYRPAFEQG